MTEPNERDKALGLLLGVYQDVDLRTIAAYRKECVKVERERVLVELRTLYLNGQMWEIHKILWPSEEDYIRAGGYK